MRTLVLSLVLGVAALGLMGMPSTAKADPYYRGGYYSGYSGYGPGYVGRSYYRRGYYGPGYARYGYYGPTYRAPYYSGYVAPPPVYGYYAMPGYSTYGGYSYYVPGSVTRVPVVIPPYGY